MRMSPLSRWGTRLAIVPSTAAAGTISHTARGFSNLLAMSSNEEAPMAPSCTSASSAFGDRSKTTHWWPSLRSRRTILAPILPSPTIPSCITFSLLRAASRLAALRRRYFLPICLVLLRGMRLSGSARLFESGGHLGLERTLVVEWQDIELIIEPGCHLEPPLSCGTG